VSRAVAESFAPEPERGKMTIAECKAEGGLGYHVSQPEYGGNQIT